MKEFFVQRSCVACHTSRYRSVVAAEVSRRADSAKDNVHDPARRLTPAATNEVAGNLDLDAYGEWVSVEDQGKLPGTYVRLAADERARFGHKPPGWDSWGYLNASRYVRRFQSRRSLLIWKVHARRLDG